MKINKKSKVHPSPSSSSSTAPAAAAAISDFSDMLNHLPAEILSLLTPLTVGDREVLAFMMKRSMHTSPPSTSSSAKKRSKRVWKKFGAPLARSGGACNHAPPRFRCFYCYGSYWERWNSSANRELIQLAIEAFDEQFVPLIPPLPEVRRFPIDETAAATAAVVVQSPAPSNHRGLARRVWPDVLGFFNSRLWRLWGPN